MITCPTTDSLEKFLRHGLDDAEYKFFESHIESCSSCQETLQRISISIPAKIHPQLLNALSETDLTNSSVAEAFFFARLTEEVLARQLPDLTPPMEDFAEICSAPELAGYEILGELGRGASGVVFRARHLELNRLVALKVLSSASHLSSEAQQRFRLEAQAIARLRHPNIVQVYDYGKKGNYPYLALELIEGDNLARWLAGVPRPAAESARLVEVLAKAISYAHCRGVIHRDLKPSNVLLETKCAKSIRPSIERPSETVWSDCDLKITDFGLAKIGSDFNETASQLTQSGMVLGTPSYIAPEQVCGHTNEVGPAADVYSLGAILYEMLTGRPPFHGATPMETLLQAAHQEPVPLLRLAPQVPRDLQTICLKCLEKNIAKRYATASDLAADLERFRKHEPIVARPLGRGRRLWRWARRHPVQAMAISTIVLLFFAIASGAIWLSYKNATKLRLTEDNLHEVAQLQSEGNWSDANAVLAQVKERLGAGPPLELRDRIKQLDQNARNHDLLRRFDDIRLERANVEKVPFNNFQADQDYAIAFRDAGIIDTNKDPAAIAMRIAASSIRAPLLAAMDDWAVCTNDTKRRTLLMDVARRADPDVWRDCVRDPVTWEDTDRLVQLAKTAPVKEESVQLLVAVGDRLQTKRRDSIEFLNRVQQTYPADFWANYFLGIALTKKKSPDAAGYFRAALALRPSSAAVYEGLGNALRAVGQVDEAIKQYWRAIQINPSYSGSYVSLGSALKTQGMVREAIEQYREAVKIDPNNAWGHYVLGNALREYCRLDEAIEQYNQAIALNPQLTQPHYDLGTALTYAGKFPEAIEECEIALRMHPKSGIAHYNIGIILQIQGRLSDSVEQFQTAVQLSPKLERAYEALGQSLMALGNFNDAEVAIHHALALLPEGHPLHSFVKLQLDQCQRLFDLEKHLPAGVANNANAFDEDTDRLLAELYFIKQQYDSSTRLYSACFETSLQPKDELYRSCGFEAACAAARTANCIHNDGDLSVDAERLLNIQQARKWLRMTLDAWASTLGSCQSNCTLLHKLYSWQASPDLSGLRDFNSIERLSPEEARECRELWDDWADVLRRAENLN